MEQIKQEAYSKPRISVVAAKGHDVRSSQKKGNKGGEEPLITISSHDLTEGILPLGVHMIASPTGVKERLD